MFGFAFESVAMNQTIADIFGAAAQTLPGLLTILNVAILLFAVFFFTSTMASHVLEYFVGSITRAAGSWQSGWRLPWVARPPRPSTRTR